MDFESRLNFDKQKLEDMFDNLSNITKQLAVIQGFVESKYGSEFTTFCKRFDQQESSSSTSNSQMYESNSSIHDDSEEYDKMPNLVSQESPSRTLGYVTVPLRQSSANSLVSKQSNSQNNAAGVSRRDRTSVIKEEMSNDNDDMMYPLHNFSDLLVEGAEEVDAGESPEFLELELDPSTLLRGEPPALQPMFADNNGSSDLHGVINNGANGGHYKRNSSRQSSSNNNNNFHRYDMDTSGAGVGRGSNGSASRRASAGNHDSSLSHKKFDCLICGIKFEFAETLKSHMDSHTGSRSVRSNSEDQLGVGNNSGAPPLPKLMPRPSISSPTEVTKVKVEVCESMNVKASRSKKSSNQQGSSSMKSSVKRRRHYNQSRPCSLICPECGLKIRDKSRLIEHLRGHTGERPFACPSCDKSYTRRDVLKTHIFKQHGELAQI